MAQQSKPNINTVWASAGDTGTPPNEFNINEGWLAEKPPFQEMNWLQNRFNEFIKHMNEFGIAEWDTDTNYANNALVIHNDVHYTSDNNDNSGNAPTSSGWTQVDFQPAMPVGSVVDWAGDFDNPPTGWAVCDGTSGTPDLRGRFTLGADSATGSGSLGNSGGSVGKTTSNSPSHNHNAVTQNAGSHSHSLVIGTYTLVESQMPSHQHSTNLLELAGFGVREGGGSGRWEGGGNYFVDSAGGSAGHNHSGTSNTVSDHSHVITDQPGHSHTIVDALPPFYVLVKIIKL